MRVWPSSTDTPMLTRSAHLDVARGASSASGARGPQADHRAAGRLVDWPTEFGSGVVRQRNDDRTRVSDSRCPERHRGELLVASNERRLDAPVSVPYAGLALAHAWPLPGCDPVVQLGLSQSPHRSMASGLPTDSMWPSPSAT